MKSKYRSVLIKLPVRGLWRHDMTIITSNLTESWFHSGLNQAFNYTSSVGFWSRTKTNHVLSKWYWESLKNITRWPIFEIWMQKYLSLSARVHVLHCCIVTPWNLEIYDCSCMFYEIFLKCYFHFYETLTMCYFIFYCLFKFEWCHDRLQ